MYNVAGPNVQYLNFPGYNIDLTPDLHIEPTGRNVSDIRKY